MPNEHGESSFGAGQTARTYVPPIRAEGEARMGFGGGATDPANRLPNLPGKESLGRVWKSLRRYGMITDNVTGSAVVGMMSDLRLPSTRRRGTEGDG
jgi:hypothetical protein